MKKNRGYYHKNWAKKDSVEKIEISMPEKKNHAFRNCIIGAAVIFAGWRLWKKFNK